MQRAKKQLAFEIGSFRMFRNKGRDLLVGRPELPLLDEFSIKIKEIWSTDQLTNFGPCEIEFETKLSNYFGGCFIILFASGTSALEALLKVMDVKGRVITTPYSFIATTTAIIRNNLHPVFVDISEQDGNLDPDLIDCANLTRQDIILGVHAYGYPCGIEPLKKISRTTNTRVIYDAAHSMGAMYLGEHLALQGDASVLSFHATKILSAIEGGAVVTRNADLANELRSFRNFGFNKDKTKFIGPGTNSKLSELHAAFGCIQLDRFSNTLQKRIELYNQYAENLNDFPAIRMLKPNKDAQVNGSYVPIIVETETNIRDDLLVFLSKANISAQPYFDKNIASFLNYNYPDYSLEITNRMVARVICLPIHSSMDRSDVKYVTDMIKVFCEDQC